MDYSQYYCHECLYAGTTPFGGLCCAQLCNAAVGWYQHACNCFKERYEQEEINESEE